MAPPDGRSMAKPGACLLALLLAGPLLVGCLSDPSTQLTARRGDLAQIELVVADDDRVVLPEGETNVSELCGAPIDQLDAGGCPPAEAAYVLLADRPAHLPDGFQDAKPLPDGLVDQLEGLGEGEHRLAEEVQAWGPHRSALVEEHERTQRLPRIVDEPDAYGHAWNGTHLANGSFEIDPTEDDRDQEMAVPNWCNERFCLFSSTLVDWTEDHLVVEHQARAGERVHAGSLDTFLTVVHADEQTFTVDGNDPRAGEAYSVYAHVTDLRGPSEGETRAPSFNLTRLGGGQVSLEDQLGQPVVIEFFATWCPSCRENVEHLTQVRDTFGDRVSIVSIGVDPWESSTALRSFVEEHNVTWPVAVDEQGEVSNAYGVGTLSTEVLVDPHGVIRHVETGVADHDRVVAILEDLAGDGEDP